MITVNTQMGFTCSIDIFGVDGNSGKIIGIRPGLSAESKITLGDYMTNSRAQNVKRSMDDHYYEYGDREIFEMPQY